jgi:hypothetical protein
MVSRTIMIIKGNVIVKNFNGTILGLKLRKFVVQNFGCLIVNNYDEAKEKCLEFLTLHIDNGFGKFCFKYLSNKPQDKMVPKKTKHD